MKSQRTTDMFRMAILALRVCSGDGWVWSVLVVGREWGCGWVINTELTGDKYRTWNVALPCAI